VSRYRLSDYLDGELGLLARWRLDRHLRGCPACRDRLSELKAVDALVHLAREPLAAGRAEGRKRLPGRLQVELGIGPVAEAAAPAPRSRRWKVAALAAAVLLLGIAGAYLAMRPGHDAARIVSLGRENRAEAEAILERARAVEVQLVWLRMQLLDDELDPAAREAVEAQLARLSDQLVAIKSDARLVRSAPPGAGAAADAEGGR
jgi:anti-sigma factor RsiW